MNINIPLLVRQAFAKQEDKQWPRAGGGFLNRATALNASEAGRCIRQLKYTRLHSEEAQAEWRNLERAGYAQRGHAVEAWFVNMFREHNATAPISAGRFEYFGSDQRSFVYEQDGLTISGTPDAIFSYDDLDIPIDVKSIDPRTNRANLPKPFHITQVEQVLWILKEAYTDFVEFGIILHVDASNFNDMWQEIVPYRADYGEWALARAEELMRLSPKELAPEGMSQPGGCDYCNFTHLCSAAVEQEYKHIDLEALERAMQYVKSR